MNNSRQSLITQAERIVESYSKKIKKEPKKKKYLILPALGTVIVSAVITALYLKGIL